MPVPPPATGGPLATCLLTVSSSYTSTTHQGELQLVITEQQMRMYMHLMAGFFQHVVNLALSCMNIEHTSAIDGWMDGWMDVLLFLMVHDLYNPSNHPLFLVFPQLWSSLTVAVVLQCAIVILLNLHYRPTKYQAFSDDPV